MNKTIKVIMAAVLFTLALLSFLFTDSYWVFFILFVVACLVLSDWSASSVGMHPFVRHSGWVIGIIAVVLSQRLGRAHEEACRVISAELLSIMNDPVIVLSLIGLIWLRVIVSILEIRRKEAVPRDVENIKGKERA